MVFTSIVIGLSHEVMIDSVSFEHRMNGLESAEGSDLRGSAVDAPKTGLAAA